VIKSLNITATSANSTDAGYIFGDQFGGNTRSGGCTTATQVVNPDQGDKIGAFGELPAGALMKHATLEAFVGAENSPNAPAGDSPAYQAAHQAVNEDIYPEGSTAGIGAQVEASDVNETTMTGTVTVSAVKQVGKEIVKEVIYEEKDQPVSRQ
jgi:hypothetical protein